jgi:hypothetical protein
VLEIDSRINLRIALQNCMQLFDRDALISRLQLRLGQGWTEGWRETYRSDPLDDCHDVISDPLGIVETILFTGHCDV